MPKTLPSYLNEYVNRKFISLERANALKQNQCERLSFVIIKESIFSKKIELDLVLYMSYHDIKILQRILKNKQSIFYPSYPMERDEIYSILNIERLNYYIDEKYLTKVEADNLTSSEKLRLENKAIIKLIECGIISVKEALKLEKSQLKKIDSIVMQKLIVMEIIPSEEALLLQESVIDYLVWFERNYRKLKLIDDTLNKFDFYELLATKKLSLNEIVGNGGAIYQWRFSSSIIQKLLAEDKIKFIDVFDADEFHPTHLEEPAIQDFVNRQMITPIQALKLNDDQANNLIFLKPLIDDHTINIVTAIGLSIYDRDMFRLPTIISLIRDGLLNVDGALALKYNERATLNIAYQLIQENYLTVQQVHELSDEQHVAIRQRDTIQAILQGNMNINQIIGGAPVPVHQNLQINDGQSTHNARVHKTVSESALKLMQRYVLKVTGEALETTIADLKNFINKLPNSFKNNAAKRCIERVLADGCDFVTLCANQEELDVARLKEISNRHNGAPFVIKSNDDFFIWGSLNGTWRLWNVSKKEKDLIVNHLKFDETIALNKKQDFQRTAPDIFGLLERYHPAASLYQFKDPGSKITTRQLFALAYLAVHDDKTRIGTLESAQQQFIEGLYESQRGYNLSAQNVDNQAADSPICQGGAFNKPIEKLASADPDCNLEFMTKTLASQKLPCVVKEDAMRYLSKQFQLAKQNNDYSNFNKIIKSIKEDDLDCIWNKIKETVGIRLFDEFSPIFNYPNNPDFTSLVAGGVSMTLDWMKEALLPTLHKITKREIKTYLADQFAFAHNQGDLASFNQLIEKIKEFGTKVVWDNLKDKITKEMNETFPDIYQYDKINFIDLMNENQQVDAAWLKDIVKNIKKSHLAEKESQAPILELVDLACKMELEKENVESIIPANYDYYLEEENHLRQDDQLSISTSQQIGFFRKKADESSTEEETYQTDWNYYMR